MSTPTADLVAVLRAPHERGRTVPLDVHRVRDALDRLDTEATEPHGCYAPGPVYRLELARRKRAELLDEVGGVIR